MEDMSYYPEEGDTFYSSFKEALEEKIEKPENTCKCSCHKLDYKINCDNCACL